MLGQGSFVASPAPGLLVCSSSKSDFGVPDRRKERVCTPVCL